MTNHTRLELESMKRETLVAYCQQLEAINQRLVRKVNRLEAQGTPPNLAAVMAELDAERAANKRHKSKIAEQARQLHRDQVEINRLSNIAAPIIAKEVKLEFAAKKAKVSA